MKKIQTLVVPIGCIIASFVNFINFIILSSNIAEFKTSIFQLLKISSILDALCPLILSASYIGLSSWWYKQFQFYFVLFAYRVLNLYSSFVNIQVAVNRYVFLKHNVFTLNSRLISKRTRINSKFRIYQVFLSILSILFYSPYLFLFQISKKTDLKNANFTSGYTIQMSKLGRENSFSIKILSCSQALIHLVNLVIMMAFSSFTVLTLKEQCNKVGRVSNSCSGILVKIKKKQNQTSKMVLYLSLVFIIHELTTLMASILDTYTRIYRTNNTTDFMMFIMYLIVIVTSSVFTITYKSYNKTFNIIFKRLFFF